MNTFLESDALAIFQSHRPEVFGWALRLLGQHHDALDVTQEVFLKWIDQMQVVPPTNARAWLRRVTTNLAIDLMRKRTRQTPSDVAPLPVADREAVDLEQQELRRDLAEAMATLSDHQRSVLIAKVHDGMTFASIAEELDISPSTAKTHYVRALGAVRDKLSGDWNPKGSER